MKNILVIEDDKLTVDFYKVIFKKSGYNPIVTEDGQKILQFLEEGDVKLIIMDINLKNTYIDGQKTDGIKLASLIKNNKNYSRIPIILVTAYSFDILGEKLNGNKYADDFIIKPIVDFNKLLGKVNNLILN